MWSLGVLVFWGVLQLVPLPPAIWQMLPERELIVAADAFFGLNNVWRPISLAPHLTINAIYALFIPGAMLLLVGRFDVDQLNYFLPVILGLGLLTGVLGVLQVSSEPGGSLYFYRITSEQFAVGLFANRNHQALFLACLYPVLAAFVAGSRRARGSNRVRLVCALIGGIALLPLILVTGSRMGLVFAVIGLISALWIAWPRIGKVLREQVPKGRLAMMVGTLLVTAGTVLSALILARDTSLTRMSDGAQGVSDDIRFAVWPEVWRLIGSMQPTGSGLGTFAEVYRIYEPDALLMPQYMNHAHNDWLELLLTAGLPGAIVLAVGSTKFLLQLGKVVRVREMSSSLVINRMGVSVVGLVGIASCFDYPLRVPSMACIFVFAAVCACAGSGRAKTSLER